MRQACNKRPEPGHPMHNSGIACHYPEGHDGPCAWGLSPSPARRGVDRLLHVFRAREIRSIDSQPERSIIATNMDTGELSSIAELNPGPWVLVTFVGGAEYAIWKATGAVYQVGPDGAVEEDPILTIDDART